MIDSNCLETKDLILKRAVIDDEVDLFENFWKHEESSKYMLWPITKNLEEAHERILRTIEYQKNGTSFCVYLKETKKAIGLAGVKIIDNTIVEDAGIGIGPSYVGKGYGTQITNALIDFSFNVLNTKIIKFSCCLENVRSARMIEKCGFIFTNITKNIRKYDNREYYVKNYELTHDDWRIV